MKIQKTKTTYSLCLFAIFLLFFNIAIYTPMNSDDYHFFTMGNSFLTHYHFYLTWSGRFVTDYISTLLLSSQSIYLKALFTSLSATILVFVIAKFSQGHDNLKNKDVFILISIFLLYWLSNPALGQTTFWIVGASNYLITNLFLLSFIYLLLYKKEINIILFIILAFLAGCSKENTGFLAPLSCLIFLCKEYINTKTINKKVVILFIISSLGFLLLIAAPGNFVRAATYHTWYEQTLMQRVWHHLWYRVPNILTHTWPIVLFFLVLYLFSGNKKNPLSRLPAEEKSIAVILLSFSILSLMAMSASPTIPHRAMLGIFLLFLCFVAKYLRSYAFTTRIQKILLVVVSAILLINFSISYIEMYIAYHNTMRQQIIRENIIQKAKVNHLDKVDIPDYYFTRLLTKGNKFDTYFNLDAYSRYFGIPIQIKKMNYNYSSKLLSYTLDKNNEEYQYYGISNILINKNSVIIKSTKKVSQLEISFPNAKPISLKLSSPKLNGEYWNGANLKFPLPKTGKMIIPSKQDTVLASYNQIE